MKGRWEGPSGTVWYSRNGEKKIKVIFVRTIDVKCKGSKCEHVSYTHVAVGLVVGIIVGLPVGVEVGGGIT